MVVGREPQSQPEGAWLADLDEWAAAARAGHAAEARRDERSLLHQAAEDASFDAVLLDLVEHRTIVVVTTADGGRHRGRLVGLGADFVSITSGRRTVFVSLSDVAAVAPSGESTFHRPAASPARSARSAADRHLCLADVLTWAVEREARVQITLRPGMIRLAGELTSMGADVATMRTGAEPLGYTYVRLASVSEISLLDSG